MAERIPSFKELVALSHSIDDTQAYLMSLSRTWGEVTLTIKPEAPVITVFLGKGSEALIGFGSSVALALKSAMDSQTST